MKRTPIAAVAVVVAALTLSACSGLRTNTVSEARPVAFPSASTSPPAQTPVEQVVQQTLPAVVNVVTNLGEGTGFVVREDGVIVTNFHVVENASTVKVLTSDEQPKTYQARVIGGDVQADLAVLKVDATGLATVPLGTSADLQLGQNVVAIGYAAGIVSSLDRHITVTDPNCQQCPQGQRTYASVVQTDAAINPGNSGGPLVDLAGNVIGINTAGTQTAENVGFAIQVDAAKPVIFQAASHPRAPVAYMGIVGIDASDAQFRFEFNPPVSQGAGIVEVVPGGPADQAGIQPGDVVVSFDGHAISTSEELGNEIRSHSPGDKVAVEIARPSGQRTTVTVTLGTNPVATP
jgi:S1-C subfamily serine protease